ncbi:MAG: putative lipid II flippase FtsW [Verrucomicrobia bacterium CG_4_10_14_3_um_filter_43_23]|nr:MAG: putative lipid II flippase FtsW [Verrucomicrobia bacterium CG1_02_43_26]PIP60043.1 MAG: putative lipid II flippase FtsW [Verrucomicrobia bacterium CG22_combo_CG10-13_8_21_14_all_43_17]PIX58109.1 MAG: putative lipid II flippase FtsW [Verrucomicrobia bacterium CG_4_10_14_3_um_filter_43_23]PIY63005.1 MAG: putative lipid II flippase FtsW [Verrucomicrobia bacterium CG_4_10_14_0_8_um_filter_43_34]PJA44931.1 MAG: putative lipid II flippase FtsW [Verrucomicrobia bacterium CG_4_9_14_3_um_filter_
MLKKLREWQTSNWHLGVNAVIVFAVISLTIVGLVTLASASQSFSAERQNIFLKQTIALTLATIAGIVLMFVDIEKIKKYAYVVAAGALLALVLVLIPGIGKSVNGAQRWIGLGVINVQPSDLAKIALVLVLARYLSDNQRRIDSFLHGYILPGIWIGVFCILVLVEPDFGTAFLCGCVGLGLLFLSGARLIYLLPSLFGAVFLFSVAVFFDPIRLKRITAFLDVEGNKSDGAYQLWQGILAFGAGGLYGEGLGQGRQQMAFLPEAHNDFIFPVIGEELGFFFTAGIAILFLMIFIVGYISLKNAPTLYHFILVAGALFFIVFQALINMGVVTGLLPTKGMSLPFISYGGSNLIVMYSFVGLILNVFRNWAKSPLPMAREL